MCYNDTLLLFLFRDRTETTYSLSQEKKPKLINNVDAWLNARISSHREKMQTQELELEQLKLAVNTLTKERDELKRDNAA